MLTITDIKTYDKEGMIEFIKNFHNQLNDSFDLISNFNSTDSIYYKNILLCGMGGSSIGG